MKSIVLILFLSFLQLFSAVISGVVVKVYDGDTFKLIDTDGGKFIIRLSDVDAPEKDQPFGFESKEFLNKLIFNKTVKVKFLSTDLYGRLVGTVYLNNLNINEKLIESGNAWVYESYSKENSLKNLEKSARDNKNGLWNLDSPQEPWIYRKKKSKLKK